MNVGSALRGWPRVFICCCKEMLQLAASQTTDMGSGSVPKLLFQLALPAVVAQIINLLYNIVDRIYIGHIPEIGATALTGVGLCMPILMLVNAFAMLCGSGGAPRAAICMGQDEIGRASCRERV